MAKSSKIFNDFSGGLNQRKDTKDTGRGSGKWGLLRSGAGRVSSWHGAG